MTKVKVTYGGSPYHKKNVTFDGPPVHRPDASKCPEDVTPVQAQSWLQEAFDSGLYEPFEGRFPKWIYSYRNDGFYMARITNPTQGLYHGHPCEAEDVPPPVLKLMQEKGVLTHRIYRRSIR